MTSQFNFQPLNNPETGIHGYRLLVVILESETETDKNRLPVSKWSLGFWSGSKIRENETVETLCDFGVFECTQDRFNLSFRFFNGDIWWRDTCSWKVQLEILKLENFADVWKFRSVGTCQLHWLFPSYFEIFQLQLYYSISTRAFQFHLELSNWKISNSVISPTKHFNYTYSLVT